MNTKVFMKSLAYVVFLRGNNVVGNTIISMKDLKKAFASLGFANIRTVLASGNVVFEAVEADPAVLATKIEQNANMPAFAEPGMHLQIHGAREPLWSIWRTANGLLNLSGSNQVTQPWPVSNRLLL